MRQQSGNFRQTFAANALLFFIALSTGLLLAEALLRLKNSDQKNYNIEMWRYAKLLKAPSQDPYLGHEHKPNAQARLENTDIRINSLGMRGPEPAPLRPGQKRILILGSSNTLGWGVDQSKTMDRILQELSGGDAQVLNGGIGNYNSERYVRLFEKRWLNLKPDIVIVHYFIRDAEVLAPGGGNFWLRNSQLAVTLHTLFHNLSFGARDPAKLVAYYRRMYSPGSPGLEKMHQALRRLDQLSKEHAFKIILTMVPDIHAVSPYPFEFIHEHMKDFSQSLGWTFVDFGGILNQVPQEDLWVMPGDPHINANGQARMARSLSDTLSKI